MSVILVSDETLRVMLWAGLRGASPTRWQSADGTWHTLTADNAAEMGALLRSANSRGFYDPNEETWEDMGIDPVYHHGAPKYAEWSTVELLRTVRYVQYQLEDPISEQERRKWDYRETWWKEDIEVNNFCGALFEHLIPQLPGIDATEVISPELLPFSLSPLPFGRLRAANADAVPLEHVRVLLDRLIQFSPDGFRWQLTKSDQTWGQHLTAENIAEVGAMLWQWCGTPGEPYVHDAPIHQEWTAIEVLSAARTIAHIGQRRPGWDDSEAHNLIRSATAILAPRIPPPNLWGIDDDTLPAALR